jgi:surface antigen
VGAGAAAGSGSSGGGGSSSGGGDGGGFGASGASLGRAIDTEAQAAFLASGAAIRLSRGTTSVATVRPVQGFLDPTGFPCRVLVQTVQVDGVPLSASGTVCRGNDGVWRLR